MRMSPVTACALSTSLAVFILACTPATEDHPITQQARPFTAFNAGAKGVAPPVAKTLTPERIARAASEPHNWLTYYGAYSGQRFSPLGQITPANVKTLKPAWVFQTGVIGLVANPATYSFEAAP